MLKMKRLYKSYNQVAVHNASVIAQPFDRSKESLVNSKKNQSRTANYINLSFYKTTTPLKLGQQSKKIRKSRSCTKEIKLSSNTLSDNTHLLESIYGSDKTDFYKDTYIPYKEEKSNSDAVKTLHKIFESLQRLTKVKDSTSVYNNYIPLHKGDSNRKSLIKQKGVKKIAHSIKGKRVNTHSEQYENEDYVVEVSIMKALSKAEKVIAELRTVKDMEGVRQCCKVIHEVFNKIISLSGKFGLLLKEILVKYQEVFMNYEEQYKELEITYKNHQSESLKQINALQSEGDELRKELRKLNEEKNKLLEEVNKHEDLISKSKKELQVQSRLMKSMKDCANKKIKELSEDLSLLYKENKKLTKIIKELCAEFGACKAKSRVMIEVGKKAIKIPKLDLSILTLRKPAKLKVVHYYNNESKQSNYKESLDDFSIKEEGVEDYKEHSKDWIEKGVLKTD